MNMSVLSRTLSIDIFYDIVLGTENPFLQEDNPQQSIAFSQQFLSRRTYLVVLAPEIRAPRASSSLAIRNREAFEERYVLARLCVPAPVRSVGRGNTRCKDEREKEGKVSPRREHMSCKDAQSRGVARTFLLNRALSDKAE